MASLVWLKRACASIYRPFGPRHGKPDRLGSGAGCLSCEWPIAREPSGIYKAHCGRCNRDARRARQSVSTTKGFQLSSSAPETYKTSGEHSPGTSDEYSSFIFVATSDSDSASDSETYFRLSSPAAAEGSEAKQPRSSRSLYDWKAKPCEAGPSGVLTFGGRAKATAGHLATQEHAHIHAPPQLAESEV